jgi:acyl carrier protein
MARIFHEEHCHGIRPTRAANQLFHDFFYPMTTPSSPAETNATLEREVAQLMVSALNLEVAPESIEADSELYGDGLGLDSIDILEIALVVSKQYGIQMKTEGEDNFAIFKSLRSLSAYIAEKRTK